MDFFTKLDNLIRSQTPVLPSAAEVLARLGTPTTSVAILDNGGITARCFSTVDDTTDTLFQACSISKAMAGLAAMRLVDQGKLRLDDRVTAILPDNVVSVLTADLHPTQVALLHHITVSHLLSHTAGLSTSGFPGYPSKPIPTLLEILAGTPPTNTGRVQPVGLPGHTLSYSGGGFTVLQLALEAATGGIPFPELMLNLVFTPLGMAHSVYTPAATDRTARAHYTGQTPCESDAHVLPELAAAGLWTTPTDLLRAVRGVQRSLAPEVAGEGEMAETRFLRRETARHMLGLVDADMALGWFAPREGSVFLHAGSNWPGFQCLVAGYDPGIAGGDDRIPKECGIAVMTNSAMGGAAVWKVFHSVAFLKGWPEVPDMLAPRANLPFEAPEEAVGERWKEWAGKWADGKSQFVIEADQEGKPVVRFADLPVLKLVPAAIPGFKRPGNAVSIDLVVEGLSLMLRLREGESGKVVDLWNGGNGRIVVLEKQSL